MLLKFVVLVTIQQTKQHQNALYTFHLGSKKLSRNVDFGVGNGDVGGGQGGGAGGRATKINYTQVL